MPTIFIASSVSTLKVASEIKSSLLHIAEVTIWNEGVFGLSSYTLEALERVAKEFDFGIFIMGADDFRQKNKDGIITLIPRDNVVFECGMFIGSLGRKRTFIIIPKHISNLVLPTDLHGVIYGSYSINDDGNLNFIETAREVSNAISDAEKTVDNENHILGKNSTKINIEPGVQYSARSNNSLIHHNGRLAPIYTGNFLKTAVKEIIIIGLSLRSFIGYFESRPKKEIRLPIVEALKRGVSI
ncbi:MAG: nucleotide-binding protein, partial [Flavobacteriales bacterium]